MPIEREFKYVLDDPNFELLKILAFDPKIDNYDITQAYLNDGCRIRKSDKKDGPIEFFFTYKKMISDDLIEIETTISEDDYMKLLSVSDRVLHKSRFDIRLFDNVWSFDYFWENLVDNADEDQYFVMAEFETIYDIRSAPPILKFAEKFLVHVDDGSYKLTSHALCDVEYAKEIMRKILVDNSK